MELKRHLVRLVTAALVQAGRAAGPARAVHVGRALARRIELEVPSRSTSIRRNLQAYFPDRSLEWVEAATACVRANAAQARLFDKHYLPLLSTPELDQLCDWTNRGVLDAALDAGRGVVLVSVHYGRFWSAPLWLSRHGRTVLAFQARQGRLIATGDVLSGGTLNARQPGSPLRALRALRRGAVICMQLDAGRVERPLVLEFLGKPTLVPASPVELARLADAIVVPAVAIPLDDGRIRLVCHGAVDPARSDPDQAVADLTRRLLEPFEAQIQTDPTQWHGIANAHRRLATTDFVEASDTSTY